MNHSTARRFFSLWRQYPHIFAVLLIFTATAARLCFVVSNQFDLVQDEAQYWDWARRLQWSYYSKGPLIAWIIKVFTAAFGDTEFGVRSGAVIGSLAAQCIWYFGVGVIMQKPRIALIALFICNTMPLFLVSGILMTTDNPLLVCWLLALFSLHAAVLSPASRLPWVVFGCAVAFGVLAKYTMLGMAGVAIVHAGILRFHGILPKGHLKRLCIAFYAGAIIGFIPIALWNAQNDWVSFRHVGRLAGVAPAAGETPPLIRFDRLPEYVGGQLGLIYPWWLTFMVYGGQLAAKRCFSRTAPDAFREKREVAGAALFASGFWPIFLFFLLWSLHTRIYANWSAMCYASGMVLAAMGVDAVLEKYRPNPAGGDLRPVVPWTRRLLPVWAAVSMVFCLIMYAQEPLSRIVPDSVNPVSRLKGWSDMGRRVGELRDALPDPQKVFIFSDQYDVTSQLAFYVPGRPVTYCADFGRRLNQYDFWPSPEDKKGWDAIFVRRKPFSKPDKALASMFMELGNPEAYQSVHRGADGRDFGIMVLRNYTGEWPRISQGIY
jgi:hypothetical protein